MCCACQGQCNHVGPHTYCEQHGGKLHSVVQHIGVAPDLTQPSQPFYVGCPHGRLSWRSCPHCLGVNDPGVWKQLSDGGWEPAEPLGWQDETEDTPPWLRRLQRALIAAVDAWRGERRDWRQGASW